MSAKTQDLPGEAADLLATLVAANVDMAAHTTNLLIESYEAQLKALAQAYVDLFDAVDEAARVVTTRRIETALACGAVTLHEAERILNGGAA